MALDVHFDEDRRLIHVTINGTWPTLPEIIAERSRLIMCGVIRAGVVELVDARGVTRGIPNLWQIEAILHAIGKPPDKRAVVVGSALHLGVGRMAEVLDPKALRVFQEEEAAVAWLLDTTAENPPLKFDRTRSGRIATARPA